MGGELPLWSLVSRVPEGQEPLRDWISLSVLFCFAFRRSGRKPVLIFLEICNSDCAEILTRFFPDISLLVPKVELQPMFEEGTTHHHAPGASGAPWCLVGCVGLHLRWFQLLEITYIPKLFFLKFYCVWTLIDMDTLRYKKHAEIRNWLWAMDQ